MHLLAFESALCIPSPIPVDPSDLWQHNLRIRFFLNCAFIAKNRNIIGKSDLDLNGKTNKQTSQLQPRGGLWYKDKQPLYFKHIYRLHPMRV